MRSRAGRRTPEGAAPGGFAPGRCTFRALGTFATLLVADPEALPGAREVLAAELAAVDAACSRFRPDSELSGANRAEGRAVGVSPLFAEALSIALGAARLTDGDVDPTCGRSLARLGYDRDFALARQDTGPLRQPAVPGGGWRRVELDQARLRLRLPAGMMLDLGATAKALAADRAAGRIAAAAGCGVLVNLGGDISVAGDPPGAGWLVGIADDAGFDTTVKSVKPSQMVTIRDGGLATSSVLGRAWQRGGVWLHHIISPATGLPAGSCWRTVSVSAASCVDANIASTAAILRGGPAVEWLSGLRLPARLVRHDGTTVVTGGWPSEAPGPRPAREASVPQAPGRTPRGPEGPQRCPGAEDMPPEASEAPAREASVGAR